MGRPVVFLDRDGTLNDDTGHYYIYRVEDFKLNAGVVEGLKLLQDAGFALVVITNQGGVAKGLYSSEQVALVHDKMHALLAQHGIQLAGVYFCPHHHDISSCNCRKPATGLLEQARDELHLEMKGSYFIGDSDRDVLAGQRMGLKTVKIAANENIEPYCQKIIKGEL